MLFKIQDKKDWLELAASAIKLQILINTNFEIIPGDIFLQKTHTKPKWLTYLLDQVDLSSGTLTTIYFSLLDY